LRGKLTLRLRLAPRGKELGKLAHTLSHGCYDSLPELLAVQDLMEGAGDLLSQLGHSLPEQVVQEGVKSLTVPFT
jgi:hypothetical protein